MPDRFAQKTTAPPSLALPFYATQWTASVGHQWSWPRRTHNPPHRRRSGALAHSTLHGIHNDHADASGALTGPAGLIDLAHQDGTCSNDNFNEVITTTSSWASEKPAGAAERNL